MSTPTAPATKCPGCGGRKSKRAELCATCRRTAGAIGVSVITRVGPTEDIHARVKVAQPPRTSIQNRVYHGKISDLAKRLFPASPTAWQAERHAKRLALRHASEMLGRPIESSTELSELEMERLIEWLDDELERTAIVTDSD